VTAPTVVTRSERVGAPRAIAWTQVGLTPAFFATLPVTDTVVAADGSSAEFIVRLGFGRLGLKRSGSLTVVEAKKPEHLRWQAALDNNAIALSGVLELREAAEDETQLTYTAELATEHGMPRLARMLAAALDDHMVDYVRQVAEAAGRQWKAEQALGAN
jgi:carbon monoxide dehydrogenase subunit G